MLNFLIFGNIIMIGFFIFRFNFLPPQIPLFYSRSLGESQLADTWMIFLLPFILNILYIVNNYFEKKISLENNLIKKVFKYLNLFLITAFTLIFIKIIFLIS